MEFASDPVPPRMTSDARLRREEGITDVSELLARVRRELEPFAVAATALEGKDVRILGWADAAVALRLARESATVSRLIDLRNPRL